MKFQVLLFTLAIGLVSVCHGQVYTGDINADYQSELDAFLIENPTATSIEGNVTINGDYMESDFTNMDALQNITSISGSLIIVLSGAETVSLTGLSSLTTIGDILSLTDYASYVDQTPLLASLDGLESLVSVEYLDLHLQQLTDPSPLDNISSVTDINITLNGGAGNVFNLTNLFPNVTTLENLWIINESYYGTYDFTGFNALTHLGSIVLPEPMAVSSSTIGVFDAFHNLETCDNISFSYLSILNTFSGFENLQTVATTLYLDVASEEYPDFASLEDVGFSLSVYSLGVTEGPLFPVLTHAGSVVMIGVMSAVTMPVLETVDYNFTVIGEPDAGYYVDNINFLSLDSIGTDLVISGTSYSDLNFLNGIEHIGGEMTFSNNPNLSDCAISKVCDRLAISPETVHAENNATGCNTVEEVIAMCSMSYVTGTVFADLDCDGVFNNDDVPFPNSVIRDQSDNPIGATFFPDGTYLATLPDFSTTTIHATAPVGFFPSSGYTLITTDADDVFADYNIAICPDPDAHNLSVFGYSWGNPSPGFTRTYHISVVNLGSNVEHAALSFDLSAMSGAAVVDADGGVVSGNIITWDIPSITLFQTLNWYITIETSSGTALGTVQQPLLTVNIIPGSITDIQPSNNAYTFSQTVIGSFDPNDKTVNITSVNVDEIISGEGVVLDYTIRFQNTGTAPAVTVRLEDEIEADLDLTTFEMLDASHAYQLAFDDDRNVEWLFENIMLADSTSDESASHGFVHFQIKTNGGHEAGDVVSNTAAIYFDFNAPIITNTATTSFYVCASSSGITGPPVACEGQQIMLDAVAGWDTYSWIMDDIEIGNGSTITVPDLSAGTYEFGLFGTAGPCTYENNFEVNVVAQPNTPVITQSGNTLTASGSGIFLWWLNDEQISGSGATISITQSGTYTVASVVGDCMSEESQGYFEFVVDIEEIDGSSPLSIMPNPMSTCATISIPGSIAHRTELTITDVRGRIICRKSVTSSRVEIIAGELQSGIYFVSLLNTDGSMKAIERLIVE